MFTTLIVQPIFNVLSFIYAIIPGHDFGVAIILFTLVARIALYPMLKKQLKHTRAMRQLQPELRKIKQAAKGNKTQEQLMMMELYKEKEIKPLAQLGLMVVQLVIFLALFSGLNRVVKNPQEMVDFSYPAVQSMSWMQEVGRDISKFDQTFLGSVDLTRSAVESDKPVYWPALLLVLGSAIVQYLTIKQTMPTDKNARRLRDILKEANTGKQVDSSEYNAAMGRKMAYFMPGLIFVLTIGFPGALALYWFMGGLIAYTQQSRLLSQDEFMMESASAVVIRKKTLKPETPKNQPKRKSARKTPKASRRSK